MMTPVFRKLAILILPLAFIFYGSVPAEAATHKWANTQQGYGSSKVRFCDGSVKTLKKGDKTSKDVCAFYLPYGKEAFVYVKETGTVLFYVVYCPASNSAGKWYTFTAKTDTSKTALSHTYPAYCT